VNVNEERGQARGASQEAWVYSTSPCLAKEGVQESRSGVVQPFACPPLCVGLLCPRYFATVMAPWTVELFFEATNLTTGNASLLLTAVIT
jgi:hypothetical protein